MSLKAPSIFRIFLCLLVAVGGLFYFWDEEYLTTDKVSETSSSPAIAHVKQELKRIESITKNDPINVGALQPTLAAKRAVLMSLSEDKKELQHPKLSSSLHGAIDKIQSRDATQKIGRLTGQVRSDDADRVQIYIYSPAIDTDLLATLETSGFDLEIAACTLSNVFNLTVF